jgi:hypothetical protein
MRFTSMMLVMLIKRIYEVATCCYPERGCQLQVASFVEPPQEDVIEAILKHCDLWHRRSPRASPDVGELVLELDAAYLGNSNDSPDQADQSRELTYVDTDNFLASF